MAQWAGNSNFCSSGQVDQHPGGVAGLVAFHGLDLSWQAYLFWTINIKPKRINPSLAFDLYPLLRSENWLDKAEGHFV
jgi:hypothetical protein